MCTRTIEREKHSSNVDDVQPKIMPLAGCKEPSSGASSGIRTTGGSPLATLPFGSRLCVTNVPPSAHPIAALGVGSESRSIVHTFAA